MPKVRPLNYFGNQHSYQKPEIQFKALDSTRKTPPHEACKPQSLQEYKFNLLLICEITNIYEINDKRCLTTMVYECDTNQPSNYEFLLINKIVGLAFSFFSPLSP